MAEEKKSEGEGVSASAKAGGIIGLIVLGVVVAALYFIQENWPYILAGIAIIIAGVAVCLNGRRSLVKTLVTLFACVALIYTTVQIREKYGSVSEIKATQSYAKGIPATVKATELSVRERPAQDSERVITLSKGASVAIVGEAEGAWIKISTGKKEGYVNKSYIATN